MENFNDFKNLGELNYSDLVDKFKQTASQSFKDKMGQFYSDVLLEFNSKTEEGIKSIYDCIEKNNLSEAKNFFDSLSVQIKSDENFLDYYLNLLQSHTNLHSELLKLQVCVESKN